MPAMIIPLRNDRGGATLTITGDAGTMSLDLPPEAAFALASNLLNLFGKTSITNRPDGTWIAR